MSEKFLNAGVTILIAIVGVAVIALLVNRNANTSGVIGAASGGLACTLRTAITGVNQCGEIGGIPDVQSKITFGGVSPTNFGGGLPSNIRFSF